MNGVTRPRLSQFQFSMDVKNTLFLGVDGDLSFLFSFEKFNRVDFTSSDERFIETKLSIHT